jgi:DNA-binding transcriptional ArsR family regulator
MVTRQLNSAVWRAVADPTRRAILDLLDQSELPAGEIAVRFRVSRPAVSRHLRVLRRARLVRERRAGRERWYRVEPGPLRAMDEWLAHYRAFWSSTLIALKRHAESKT